MRRREPEALERLLAGRPAEDGEGVDELSRLATLGRHVGASARPAASPDPAFKAALRAELVDEARDLAAAPAPLTRRVRAAAEQRLERWRYSTRVAAATTATALALSGGGGVAVAADRAMPSDVLYPVKLAIQDARAALVRDDVERGRRHLAQADARVDEAERAAALDDGSGAARALRESAVRARRGATVLIRDYQAHGDRAVIDELAAFAERARDRVAHLAARLDGAAARDAAGAIVVLERIEARLVAIGVCPVCSDHSQPPARGLAFDFSRIPPADEPFTACPCDDGEPAPAARRGAPERGSETRDPAGPPPAPADDPSDPDEPSDPGSGLPPPVGDIVDELLRGVVTLPGKSAEKRSDGLLAPIRLPDVTDEAASEDVADAEPSPEPLPLGSLRDLLP